MDVVFVLFTAWIGIRGSDARASVIDCISVTTPRQLQESVSTGVTHVVVNDHIDISNLPSLSGSLGQGAEVLTIQRNSNGRYTKSIVGNCTEAPEGLLLDPAPEPGQCVISLRQDFLDVAVADSDVWLSGLYLRLPGLPRHQSAVVTARGRGLYLTNMTFAGDNELERGLHVMERSKVLVSGSQFYGFNQAWGAAMLLRTGARATVHDTVFRYNRAGEGSVAGLLAGNTHSGGIGAVAWFHDCSFSNNTESVPSMIAIDYWQVQVYTNTDGLTVWRKFCTDKHQSDRDDDSYTSHCALKPYKLAPLSAVRQEESSEDVFKYVAAGAQALPRPSDSALRQVIGEQVACTGMLPPHILALPSGFNMTVVDGPWYELGWGDYFILSMALCVALVHVLYCLYCMVRIYNVVLQLVGFTHRVAKAMLRWATATVTKVKGARAKAVECNRLKSGADGVALEVAVLREGNECDSC